MTERVRRRGSAISTAVEIKPPPSTAKKQHAGAVFLRCGPYRIRTDDLLIANEALYQLS